MFVIVAGHAAISYMVTPIGWAVQDDSRHLAADLFVWLARALAMPVFFWLAGYFARFLDERGALIRHRVTRILVPLVVLLVPMSLLLNELWTVGRAMSGPTAIADNVPRVDGASFELTLSHLWFLYYLLFATAIVMVVARVARGAPAWLGAVAVAALVLGPLVRAGELHLVTPLYFTPDLDVLSYHLGFFAWGWLVHAHAGELERYAARSWELVVAAVLAFGGVLPTLADTGDPAAGRAPIYAIVASGVFTVALVAAFVGTCMRFARRDHPVIRIAADGSFATYVAHLPIVVGLQVAFAHVALPAPLEYLAILVATYAICLGGYAVVARLRHSRAKK
jgi:glucan biosynthesis protein C